MIAKGEKLLRTDIILWAILLIAEIIILMVGLTHEGLWYDEACSMGIIRHSPAEIWDIVKNDVHPPLYFYMLKLFSLLFGNSVFAMRTFSVLGILALFSLGIGPVRRAYGKTAGLMFSFLVMTTPIYLAIAQEIRMYAWAVFWVTGGLLYAYLAILENKKSDWIKFGVLVLAAIYTHYYALVAMVILCGLMFIWFLTSPKKNFRPMFFIIIGLVILCYLPWLFRFQSQVKGIWGNFWIPEIRGDIIWQTLIYPFGYKFLKYDPLANISFWLAAGLFLWSIGAAVLKRTKMTVIYPAAGVYGLTLLALIIFSLVFWPVLFPRQMLPISGLLLLVIACGLEQLPNKKLIPVFGLIFLVLMIPHVITVNQSRFNGPIREITGYLSERLQPGDVFIHTAESSWGVFSYYFPKHRHFYYIIKGNEGCADCRTFEPNGSAGLDLDGFLQSNRSQHIWFVDHQIDNLKITAEIFRDKPVLETQAFEIPDSFYAVRIYKIKR